MTTTFLNRVAIVTGASSGIGRALALRLADEHAWLALAARNAERLEALAVECRQRGAKAIAVPTDVACDAQCKALVDRTCGEYGRLDMLINNAGIAIGSRLEDLPDLHLFKEVVDVNFYGMVYCTYHALPHLRESKGRIVNVSSLGGKIAAGYLVGKGANLNVLSNVITKELTAEQVFLLNDLIQSATRFTIHGIDLVIAQASVDHYIGDIPILVHKLKDMKTSMCSLFWFGWRIGSTSLEGAGWER